MLLSFQNKKRKAAPSLKVGTYDSIVKDIGFDPDYCADEALFVKYSLTDETGTNYEYREIFFNSESNKRTQKFFDYLVSNGISLENYLDFKGCREKLTIKRTVRKGRTMLTIDGREFVSLGIGDENAIQSA